MGGLSRKIRFPYGLIRGDSHRLNRSYPPSDTLKIQVINPEDEDGENQLSMTGKTTGIFFGCHCRDAVILVDATGHA